MTATVPASLAAATGTVTRVPAAPAGSPRTWRSYAWRPEWLVLAVALGARLTVIFRHGGLDGLFGYDSGVYFAGADSLVHGRMPYLDYVQLHPPAITVALAPFALLTHVMSDSAAFNTAILAFVVLGAVNAVLVFRVCRGLGLGGAGALTAGLFYAVWTGSVGAEFLIKLEPLANALVLAALLLALRAERRPGARWPSVLAGVPLGLALSVKIWWVVPVLALIVWHGVRTRSVRHGTSAAAGAALSAVALNAPFFAAAPRQMWSMVVVDQLTRARSTATPPVTRLKNLLGMTYFHLSATASHLLLGVLAVLALMAAASAWRVRAVRPAIALLAVQSVVVLAAPSWFPYYCDYLAVGASIAIGGAAAHAPGVRTVKWARSAGIAALATATGVTSIALAGAKLDVAPFPAGAGLARNVASTRCVATDSPAAQIRMDALSRGLADGCPNWVDVTGPTYGPYRSAAPRARNPRWQRAFLAYLQRGQAIVLVRGNASGASPAFRAALAKADHVTHVDGYTVYRARAGRGTGRLAHAAR